MEGSLVIDLLRHGEAQGGGRIRGSTDDPLTQRGWKQMRKATAGRRWDRIVTSPLTRCRDFGAALAQRLGCPLQIHDGFRERDFGDWEGRTFDQITAEDPESPLLCWTDPSRHTPPGAEPFDAFLERVNGSWEELITCTEPGRILLIAHGGTIRAILAGVLELPPTAIFRIAVPYAARSRLRVDREQDATWIALEQHGITPA